MTKPNIFDETAANRLIEFLSGIARPEGTFSYCELSGFLFAVVCSPEPVQLNEWLPQVFNSQGRGKGGMKLEKSALDNILALYNFVNDGVTRGTSVFPPKCDVHQSAMNNIAPDAPLSQWARGFAEGHDWLSDVWDAYAPTSVEEELGRDLLVMTCFVSQELAQEYRAEFQTQGGTLESFIAQQLASLTEAIQSYARIGRALSSQASPSETTKPAIATNRVEKRGRNDLCACGSGKKYKNCCGATRH